MQSSSQPAQSQYAAAARVPLIKSPSLRVPKPVEMPADVHPLPQDVTPYFVYPFTLEPHVITLESSRRATLAMHAARREAFLRAREEEKEKRKRDKLRKVAPGFEPNAGVLVPTRNSTIFSGDDHRSNGSDGKTEIDVMDDLVEQLARLESSHDTSTSR